MSKTPTPTIHSFDMKKNTNTNKIFLFKEATEAEWHTSDFSYARDYPGEKSYLYSVDFTDSLGATVFGTHIFAGISAENDILLSILSELGTNNEIIGKKNTYSITISRVSKNNKNLNNETTISNISSTIGGDKKRNETLIAKALSGDIIALEKLLILQKELCSK